MDDTVQPVINSFRHPESEGNGKKGEGETQRMGERWSRQTRQLIEIVTQMQDKLRRVKNRKSFVIRQDIMIHY